MKQLIVLAGLMATPLIVATPAGAGGLKPSFNFSPGNAHAAQPVHQVQYATVSPRRVNRILRREGLYPLSRIRFGRNSYRVRAENDFGDIFRVVGDIRTGQIFTVRPLRSASYAPRPAWQGQPRRNNWGNGSRAGQFRDPWNNNGGWNAAPRPAWQGNRQSAPANLLPVQPAPRVKRQKPPRSAIARPRQTQKRNAGKNRNRARKIVRQSPPPVVAAQPTQAAPPAKKTVRIIPLKKIDPDLAGGPLTDGSMR